MIKWIASSRWSFDRNSACGSLETTTIGKMHSTLLYISFSVLSVAGVYDYSNYCLERLCETESQRESVRIVKSTRTFNLAEQILLKESSKKSLKHRMDSYRTANLVRRNSSKRSLMEVTANSLRRCGSTKSNLKCPSLGLHSIK